MPILHLQVQEIATLLQSDVSKVMIVVGAGVPMGATDAGLSWEKMLKSCLDFLFTTDEITKSAYNRRTAEIFAAFHPVAPEVFKLETALQHAELLEKELTTPNRSRMEAWLRGVFENFKAVEGKKSVLEAIRDLQLAGALVMTTNYDSLLEDATGLAPVLGRRQGSFCKS